MDGLSLEPASCLDTPTLPHGWPQNATTCFEALSFHGQRINLALRGL